MQQLELSFVEEPRTPQCGSCGVAISEGDLCATCEQAFSSVLAHAPATVTEPSIAEPQIEPAAPNPLRLDAMAQPPVAIDEAASAETPIAPSPGSPVLSGPVAAASATVQNRAALLTVAVVVVISMVGFPIGARWLEGQLRMQAKAANGLEQPARAKDPAPPHRAKAPAVARVAPESEAKARLPEPVAPAVLRRGRPQPPAVKTGRSPVAATNARPSNPGIAAPIIANATEEVAPVAPALPPSPPPVFETPTSLAPQPPVGRLFEPSEVDEAPRIATRVEPQVSADLATRPGDVVVVRILVSHTGHPFRVNLLRRSRFGAEVDEAVLAAVRRWTFSPARKRGEMVSCWYNFGVPLKAE